MYAFSSPPDSNLPTWWLTPPTTFETASGALLSLASAAPIVFLSLAGVVEFLESELAPDAVEVASSDYFV
jgi:predicted permease